MTIAVDFDGVIHAYSRGWADGTIYDEPLPGALDGLRTLMDRDAVFVFTSRSTEHVADWLFERGEFNITWEPPGESICEFWNDRERLLITNRKLPATVYLDDRAVRFEDWGQALTDLVGEPGTAATEATEPVSPSGAVASSGAAFRREMAAGIKRCDEAADMLRTASSLRTVIFEAMREAYIERCLLDRTTPKEQIETLTDAVIAAILPMTRTTAALGRMSEADVQRVTALYEQWVKAGPPPLGVPLARWWDARLVELHNAILPPTDQTKEQ